MQLKKFRVQNYKKVHDTGWVSCRDVTVLVGKNESGKSAVFRGLSKLNPSDGEKYDPLKEFPRRRYTDEFKQQDWPAASAVFDLDPTEREALTSICPGLQQATTVTFTRHYSWRLTVAFDPPPPPSQPVPLATVRQEIDEAVTKVQGLTADEGRGEALGSIKKELVAALTAAKATAAGDGDASKTHVDPIVQAIASQANEQWQKNLLAPIGDRFRGIADATSAEEKRQAARNWVTKHLPRFIYFDKYDVIDSAIHIPTFVKSLTSDPPGPRVRTTHCLFEYVGLEPDELVTLWAAIAGKGDHEEARRKIDERAILVSAASNAMTTKFGDWYLQRKHKFHYQLDGEYFRIWVSDDLDPSQIELDQRSVGMQYFFSFFTVFLVESQRGHANSILLLDEPGLHLHGTAQAKVLELFDNLAHDNQILYTTHSPFMVDVDHLERARAVYEDEEYGTTRITEDIWPRDKASLFPLQAALGYQLVKALFISKRQVIVEGQTDHWILTALGQVLSSQGRTTLRHDIFMIPSAGLVRLLPLASMLIGHEVEVAGLLDGDEPGRKEGAKLVENLLGGDDRKCLFIGDFVSNTHAELEDIFPQADYIGAVSEAYADVELDFTPDEQALHGVVNKVTALFRRKDVPFEKWKAAAVLRDRILASPDAVDADMLNTVERIFTALNALFTGPDEATP